MMLLIQPIAQHGIFLQQPIGFFFRRFQLRFQPRYFARRALLSLYGSTQGRAQLPYLIFQRHELRPLAIGWHWLHIRDAAPLTRRQRGMSVIKREIDSAELTDQRQNAHILITEKPIVTLTGISIGRQIRLELQTPLAQRFARDVQGIGSLLGIVLVHQASIAHPFPLQKQCFLVQECDQRAAKPRNAGTLFEALYNAHALCIMHYASCIMQQPFSIRFE